MSERFWGTPPELLQRLNAEYGPFDCDPCPHPLPAGYDGVTAPWGARNYVNPPFGSPGPFVRRAIAEYAEGRSSLLVLPVTWWTHVLLQAGASIAPLGRVKWLELETRIPGGTPGVVAAFHLDASKSTHTPPLFTSQCFELVP